MEIPGRVSLYCPLIDAKGTTAQLVGISDGYYQLEVAIKGATHTMLVPIAQSALYFLEPEVVVPVDELIER